MPNFADSMDSITDPTTPTQATFHVVDRPRPDPIRITLPPKRRTFEDHWDTNDPDLVSLFSFLTGVVFSGTLALAWYFWPTPQALLYLTFLSLFHFLEYFITAKYKPEQVTLDCKFIRLSLLIASFSIQQWFEVYNGTASWRYRIRCGVVFLS